MSFMRTASEHLRPRTCGVPTACWAPAVVRAAFETRLGRVGWLVVASCSSACLTLMPVHAAGPQGSLEAAQAMTAPAKGAEEKASPQAFPMEEFLDRLMAAESGGRVDAKNPRSTALGPFQFIEPTFLFVVNKYFASEVASLTNKQVLALRTDMAFSRRAAGAYSNHLIAALKNDGLPATTVNVRLAYLVGPAAAVRLLKTRPDQPLKKVLSADAIAANPFMSGATIAKLVRKAAADMRATAPTRQVAALRDEPAATAVALKSEPAATAVALESEPAVTAVALKSEPAAAAVASESGSAATAGALKGESTALTPAKSPLQIKCEIGLASCRKWIALAGGAEGATTRAQSPGVAMPLIPW